MNISVNGKPVVLEGKTTVGELQARYCPGADVAIVNAVPCADETAEVFEGDRVYLIRKGEQPDATSMKSLLYSRQPAFVTRKLARACAGIAGAGGLGTVVAEALARAGIGRLIIADFDVVEPSNLNRQRYFVNQIGLPKVEALAENLRRACPFVQVIPVETRVTAANCGRIFAGCHAVAECFDSAANKADIVFGLRKDLPQCTVVAASGLAGLQAGTAIKARKISNNFFVVGDMISDADTGSGLFASRVGIAASMQAHIIIQTIAGEPL